MHPWIKSDKPGKCTICGMDLSPVYESAQSFDAAAKDVVILPAGSPRVAGIATAPAQKMPLVRTLRVAGMVDDDATRHRYLAATIKGRVDKLYVNFVGAEVEEGQPLAEFFSRELLAAISEFNQAGGEGGLRQAATLKLRQMGLTEKQIAELPKRDPKSLTVQILAPVSGTVVAQDVFEGKWVEEGEKMLEIADFRKMWFKFDAYERDLPWLKLGQEVEIRTPSHPGRVFKAPITFIDPNLDEITRTAKVRVDLDNPLVEENGRMRRTFLHRLFAEASVQIAAPETLVVPRAAVLWPGGQPRVFVDEGEGAFRLRRVTLGREGDAHLEITSGLAAGDKVVVRGGVLLDGQAQLSQQLRGGARSRGARRTVIARTSARSPARSSARWASPSSSLTKAGRFSFAAKRANRTSRRTPRSISRSSRSPTPRLPRRPRSREAERQPVPRFRRGARFDGQTLRLHARRPRHPALLQNLQTRLRRRAREVSRAARQILTRHDQPPHRMVAAQPLPRRVRHARSRRPRHPRAAAARRSMPFPTSAKTRSSSSPTGRAARRRRSRIRSPIRSP